MPAGQGLGRHFRSASAGGGAGAVSEEQWLPQKSPRIYTHPRPYALFVRGEKRRRSTQDVPRAGIRERLPRRRALSRPRMAAFLPSTSWKSSGQPTLSLQGRLAHSRRSRRLAMEPTPQAMLHITAICRAAIIVRHDLVGSPPGVELDQCN